VFNLKKTRKLATRRGVKLVRSQGQVHVWLVGDNGRKRRRTGAVHTKLISDAQRYGQDLVGELIDCTLKQAERLRAGADAD